MDMTKCQNLIDKQSVTNIKMADLDELKKSIQEHLYSDLTDLLIEFLEPCLDYSVSKCTHEVAFCKCGHRYKFYHSFFSGEKYLWDKFCPFCSRPNPHKTEIQHPSFFPGPLVRSTHLTCNICKKSAESYAHKFCNACQTPYGWDQE